MSAWTIAAIGERAPERMFVAVRAIAPVAGMPPKNGVTTLAMPSASSSASGSWRVPAMPSAITADSSDSMPPSIATANAPDSSARSVREGELERRAARPAGVPRQHRQRRQRRHAVDDAPADVAWKRSAIVATACPGKKCPSAAASSAAIGSATSGAGTRFTRRGIRSSIASVAAATTSSASEALPRASHIAASRSKKCAGLRASCRPKTSLSCSVAMTVAMPAVKPVVTGCGMNSMNRPRRARPIAIRMSPPIAPESSRPASPNFVKIGASTTMNAAVGPVTCVREPPSAATSAPATIDV